MKDAIKKILQDPYSLSLSSLFLFIACWFYPVNSFLSRCTLICIFLFFWFSPYIAGVRNLKFIIAHLLLTIFVIASPFIFIRKSKPFETNELYLKNLHSFAGTPYYWGGENLIGIDCSGLPRKSMMNACFYTGLFSKAAELWWYDSSARALSEHYRNYTEKVASFSSLRQVDYSLLKAGDMAVTSDGIHVIVYLGNERWIQADPNQGRVVIEDPKVTKSSWFDLKVNVVRWSIF
ncbi:MAG: C40 family peptidase [Lentisphaeraceae bacterium]|nr:C40 family peptidase [Lentisphaeraceae bacterium]